MSRRRSGSRPPTPAGDSRDQADAPDARAALVRATPGQAPLAPGKPAAAPRPAVEAEIVEDDLDAPDDPLVASALDGDLDDDLDDDGGSSDDDGTLGADEGEHGEQIIPLAGGQAVLVRDALTRYLSEVSRYPRLSPDEEHDLAVRWTEHRDREALAALVTGNLRLVVAVALSFRRAFANVLDLIQEGNMGLLEAAERFDPYKGTRLSTYATFWIRSRIVRYLLDNWRLVRVGTTNARRKLIYGLRQERERLEREGITPTPKLLAAAFGATEEDVVAVGQALGARDASLDAPVGEDGKSTAGDVTPGDAPSPERLAAEADFRDKLARALDDFSRGASERELALLRERLMADEPVTLQDLADREGVTREAIRQTEVRLVARLRDYMLEHFPEAADIHLRSD